MLSEFRNRQAGLNSKVGRIARGWFPRNNGVDFPTSDEEVPSSNSGDAVRLMQANELVAVGICHREKQMIHPAVVLTDR